jgi:hypothetical protein
MKKKCDRSFINQLVEFKMQLKSVKNLLCRSCIILILLKCFNLFGRNTFE